MLKVKDGWIFVSLFFCLTFSTLHHIRDMFFSHWHRQRSAPNTRKVWKNFSHKRKTSGLKKLTLSKSTELWTHGLPTLHMIDAVWHLSDLSGGKWMSMAHLFLSLARWRRKQIKITITINWLHAASMGLHFLHVLHSCTCCRRCCCFCCYGRHPCVNMNMNHPILTLVW